jgi:hypothetical protein
MSLRDAIDVFKTGDYIVRRTVEGSYTKGIYTPGGVAEFPVAASAQPTAGRDLQVLREAQHGEEIKVLFTRTELRTREPGQEPDRVVIKGEEWEVKSAVEWDAFGESHWIITVARQVTP